MDRRLTPEEAQSLYQAIQIGWQTRMGKPPFEGMDGEEYRELMDSTLASMLKLNGLPFIENLVDIITDGNEADDEKKLANKVMAEIVCTYNAHVIQELRCIAKLAIASIP